MHIPQPFRVDDPRTLADFMRTFDFVAVGLNAEGSPASAVLAAFMRRYAGTAL